MGAAAQAWSPRDEHQHVRRANGGSISTVKGHEGDRINSVLATAGSLLLRWLAELSRALIEAHAETLRPTQIA
jgi:hypothetical protein